MPKNILIVAHDRPLSTTHMALLEYAGYKVKSVPSDHDAAAMLQNGKFDLVLIGNNSKIGEQRLRRKCPAVALKIESDLPDSSRPSSLIDSEPGYICIALNKMLGDGVRLTPLNASTWRSGPMKPRSHPKDVGYRLSA